MYPPIQGTITPGDPRVKEKFRFTFPGELNTTENSYIPIVWTDHAVTIEKLEAALKTAPVGASVILTFKKITKSTGVLGATVGTVTIVAAAFTASSTVSVALATTEGLVMEVTQTGVATKGSDLSGMAIAA